MSLLYLAMDALRSLLRSNAALRLANLALRQQLLVFQRKKARPRLRSGDRFFWVLLKRIWPGWRSTLFMVRPETVVRWHRQGFRAYWRWRSTKTGRPPIEPQLIRLIRRLSTENPLWGTPRIQAELELLGHTVAESTVDKYRSRPKPQGGGQSWMTFLRNHIGVTAACDFFVVPTICFRLLYCFVVLTHNRRRIVHFNVTPNPTARWTARQILEAFPGDGSEPKYLVRDRDGIYGEYFSAQLDRMEIEEVVISPRSPWQNPFAERVIGTIRRECLDHVIVLNERHLRRILRQFGSYYHEVRPHQSLERNAPVPRTSLRRPARRVLSRPILGGLHHAYSPAA